MLNAFTCASDDQFIVDKFSKSNHCNATVISLPFQITAVNSIAILHKQKLTIPLNLKPFYICNTDGKLQLLQHFSSFESLYVQHFRNELCIPMQRFLQILPFFAPLSSPSTECEWSGTILWLISFQTFYFHSLGQGETSIRLHNCFWLPRLRDSASEVWNRTPSIKMMREFITRCWFKFMDYIAIACPILYNIVLVPDQTFRSWWIWIR